MGDTPATTNVTPDNDVKTIDAHSEARGNAFAATFIALLVAGALTMVSIDWYGKDKFDQPIWRWVIVGFLAIALICLTFWAIRFWVVAAKTRKAKGA